jgi:hypothetical protein
VLETLVKSGFAVITACLTGLTTAGLQRYIICVYIQKAVTSTYINAWLNMHS